MLLIVMLRSLSFHHSNRLKYFMSISFALSNAKVILTGGSLYMLPPCLNEMRSRGTSLRCPAREHVKQRFVELLLDRLLASQYDCE
ncbi:hypothetical protein Pla144_49190 [Bythopirellula polymerisocia]|uniref:Uncharacterized protein n=1 Tax=Bythopirellula polymerisocia TaxID=2528003 RepID=A0A5C6C9C7_9BACT|nr:hypothetical protein Pla144_49190 [Bythopirellula polymerisocia]